MTKNQHDPVDGPLRLSKKEYEAELARLQTEMVAMQVVENIVFAHGNTLAVKEVGFDDVAIVHFIEGVDIVGGNVPCGLFHALTISVIKITFEHLRARIVGDAAKMIFTIPG